LLIVQYTQAAASIAAGVPPHYGGYHPDNGNADHQWQQQQQQYGLGSIGSSSSGYAAQPSMYTTSAAAPTATATAGNEHRVMGQGLSELLGHDGAGVKVHYFNTVHLTVGSCHSFVTLCAGSASCSGKSFVHFDRSMFESVIDGGL
jgi:hypothetical protein